MSPVAARTERGKTQSVVEIRVGAAGNVLEIRAGRVEVDVPRSVGYFGGLAAAVGLGLIEV